MTCRDVVGAAAARLVLGACRAWVRAARALAWLEEKGVADVSITRQGRVSCAHCGKFCDEPSPACPYPPDCARPEEREAARAAFEARKAERGGGR